MRQTYFLFFLLFFNTGFSQNKSIENIVHESISEYKNFTDSISDVQEKKSIFLSKNIADQLDSLSIIKYTQFEDSLINLNEKIINDINELRKDSNNDIRSYRYTIALLTLAFTIIFALSLFSSFRREKRINTEVSESIERNKKNDQKENRFIKKYETNFKNLETKISNLEIKTIDLLSERSVFLDFHQDLIKHLDLNSKISPNNVKERKIITANFERNLREHNYILSLYSYDSFEIFNACFYLKHKGTSKSIPHLKHIIENSNDKETMKHIETAIAYITTRNDESTAL